MTDDDRGTADPAVADPVVADPVVADEPAGGAAPAGEAAGGSVRWVLQDRGADTLPRLGTLEDGPGGGVRVRFLSGEVVDWDALPRSCRPVEEGSLPWRTGMDRAAVLAQLAAAPGEVLSSIVREAGAPVQAAELQARLGVLRLVATPGAGSASAGAPTWDEVWRRGRTELVRHPHVVVERNRYVWSATPVERAAPAPRERSTPARRGGEPDVDRLLHQVLAASSDAQRAQDARERLRDLARSDALSPLQRAAGAATSALIGEVVDWDALPSPSSLTGDVLDRVLQLARRQGAFTWLARLAVETTTPRVAQEAADQLAASGDPAAADAVRDVLGQLAADARSGRVDAEALAAKLAGLLRAVPRPTPAAVVGPALGLLGVLGRVAGAPAARDAAVAALVGLAHAEPATLHAAVGELEGPVVEGLLRTVAPQDLAAGSARVALLDAVAATRPEVLAQAPEVALAGLTGDDLPGLCAEPALAGVLCAPEGEVARRVTVPALQALLYGADLPALLAMEGWPAPLRALVPAAEWAAQVRRASAQQAPGGLLVRAFDAVEAEAMAVLGEELDALRAQLDRDRS